MTYRQMKSRVRTLVKMTERKITDVNLYLNAPLANIGSPASFGASDAHRIHFFNIGQGDQLNQRVGNKILAKWIKLNYQIIPWRGEQEGGSRPTASQTFRVMVVMDRNTSTSAPLLNNDILRNQDATGLQAPIQLTNQISTFTSKRYKILYNKLHTYVSWGDPAGTNNADHPQGCNQGGRIVKCKYIKLNKTIYYNDLVSGGFGRNHIYLYIFSDNEVSTTYGPQVCVLARCCYVDN